MLDHRDIEKNLETKLEQIESKLKIVEGALGEEAPETIAELGTFSWHQETRETRHAIMEHLAQVRETIMNSLLKLRNGAYGICEDCGKQIEEERLKVIPTAAVCVTCCMQITS